MNSDRFSKLELRFLEEGNWFKSLRILELHPQLMNAEFGERLAVSRAAADDPEEVHLLEESAWIIRRAIEVGVEKTAEEKLGRGGVLAGQARETRERYYKERDPRLLLESLDQFATSLECADDPLVFDQGRTMQGFGATLIDLWEVQPDPAINYVGCLALLGSMTAHLSTVAPYSEDVWVDRLETLMKGIRMHLQRIDTSVLQGDEPQFYESLTRACAMIDDASGDEAKGFFGKALSMIPVLSMALAAARTPGWRPALIANRDPRFQEVVERWCDLVCGWIDLYGSDCLRLLVAYPLSTLLPDPLTEEPSSSAGRRIPAPDKDAMLAYFNESDYRPRGPITAGREVLSLLCASVLIAAADPAESLSIVEQADALLGQAEDWPEVPLAEAITFHRLDVLTAVATCITVHLQSGHELVESFRRIREALDITLLERIVAEANEVLSADPELFSSFPLPSSLPPATEAALQMAICLESIVRLLEGVSVELGLPNAARYGEMRKRIDTLVFGGHPEVRIVEADEGTPRLERMERALTRFERDLGSVEEDEREELRSWLVDGYEEGRLSFLTTSVEVTFLVNLSWLHLMTGHPETTKWAGRARKLALEVGMLSATATADVNAASHYLWLLRVGASEPIDFEETMSRFLFTVGVLSHAIEAFQIGTVGLLSDPEDRYHIDTNGYPMLRRLIEGALFSARDGAMLAEYLLNARGMWFLLNSYEPPGSPSALPTISWRGRCWPAEAGPIEEALSSRRAKVVPTVELAGILVPGEGPEAIWFGSVISEDRSELASVLIAAPAAFVATFEAYPETADRWRDGSYEEVARCLGGCVPDRLWQIADLLVERSERLTMFASPDPDLPPISMGLWKRDEEAPAMVLADAFDIVYCPSLSPRDGWVPWSSAPRAPARRMYAVCDPLGDLPGARTVPVPEGEVCGNAMSGTHPPANRDGVLSMIEACAGDDGVFIYQGHSYSGAISRPDAAGLLLEPVGPSTAVGEPLRLTDLLRAVRTSPVGRMPRRMAFLSCASGSGGAPYDATGLAMGAIAGGSDAVVSTLQPVADSVRWRSVAEEMAEVMMSSHPWSAFADWQRHVARSEDAVASEEAKWALSSLAMFGTPFVSSAGSFGSDE